MTPDLTKIPLALSDTLKSSNKMICGKLANLEYTEKFTHPKTGEVYPERWAAQILYELKKKDGQKEMGFEKLKLEKADFDDWKKWLDKFLIVPVSIKAGKNGAVYIDITGQPYALESI